MLFKCETTAVVIIHGWSRIAELMCSHSVLIDPHPTLLVIT